MLRETRHSYNTLVRFVGAGERKEHRRVRGGFGTKLEYSGSCCGAAMKRGLGRSTLLLLLLLLDYRRNVNNTLTRTYAKRSHLLNFPPPKISVRGYRLLEGEGIFLQDGGPPPGVALVARVKLEEGRDDSPPHSLHLGEVLDRDSAALRLLGALHSQSLYEILEFVHVGLLPQTRRAGMFPVPVAMELGLLLRAEVLGRALLLPTGLSGGRGRRGGTRVHWQSQLSD